MSKKYLSKWIICINLDEDITVRLLWYSYHYPQMEPSEVVCSWEYCGYFHSKGMDQVGSWVEGSMFVHVCVCCGCGCVSPYVCVCLCCVHACVCRSRQGWQEGKSMIRLRSRSKDDHRSHGNKKDWVNNSRWVPWLWLKMFTEVWCIRLETQYLRGESMYWYSKILIMYFK